MWVSAGESPSQCPHLALHPPVPLSAAGRLDPRYVIEYKSDEALQAISAAMDNVVGWPTFGALTPTVTAANTKDFIANILWALEPRCQVNLTAQAGPGDGFSRTVFKNIPPDRTLDLHAALRGPDGWMAAFQAAACLTAQSSKLRAGLTVASRLRRSSSARFGADASCKPKPGLTHVQVGAISLQSGGYAGERGLPAWHARRD